MNFSLSYLVPVCLGLFAMASAGVVVFLQLRRQRENLRERDAVPPNSDINPYQPLAGLDSMSSADVYRGQSRNFGAMIALPVACAGGGGAVGVVSRLCRPLIVGPVHYEALISTAVLCLAAVLLVVLNCKTSPKLAHLCFQLENFSLWIGYASGWTVIQKSLWDDFVFVVLATNLCVGFAGSLLLLALQSLRRRLGAGSDGDEP